MTKLNKRSIEKCGDLPKWGFHFLELVSNIKKGSIISEPFFSSPSTVLKVKDLSSEISKLR